MPAGPPLNSRVDTVVVLRALTGVGDHMCTLPALRALRAGLPHAHVAVLAVPGAEAVLSRFPEYVDELIPFAGFPGIPEQPFAPADLPGFYQAMVERRFDLALQMQGNGLVSNSLVAMLGARITAGYYLPGHYRPNEEWFMEYPGHLPEIRRHLALMAFLGFPGRGEYVEFPVTGADREELERTIWETALPGSSGPSLDAGGYVCIHPGAKAGPRRWSPAGFAAIADAVVETGMRVVFTGQAGETELVGRIRRLMRGPALDLSGKTSVGALAALIGGAALIVCNDTGVSHLAAALRVPSVVVFAGTMATGSDPLRWAPLDPDLHLVVARDAGPEPPGVPIARVLHAVRRQLERDAHVA